MTINPRLPEEPGRKGKWMWTYTGRRFWPVDPRVEDMCLEDIAHALACQNRFAGHTREPYTVAQHCVHVSELCDSADAMDGLFHDASEAYVVDIPRPLKYSAGMENYKPIEMAVQRVVSMRFGLKLDIPESVHRADEMICVAEMRDLMPGITLESLSKQGLLKPSPAADSVPLIKPWPWYYAKEQWLARYRELGGA